MSAVAHHCLTIEFNRPDALNALRPEMLSESARLVQQGSDDEAVSVIVLRGAGRAFSAGVDLKVLQGIKPEGGIIGNVFDEPAALLAAAIRDAGVPVIARAVGACFTGALEVALHCDFVYTTDASKFGDTHTKIWSAPDVGNVSDPVARCRPPTCPGAVVYRESVFGRSSGSMGCC